MNDEWDMEKYFPPLFGIPTSIKENIEIIRKPISHVFKTRSHTRNVCSERVLVHKDSRHYHFTSKSHLGDRGARFTRNVLCDM